MKELLLHLVNSIRPSDILDIAVIAVLAYMVLIWLKKTGSRFVFIGIIILSVIYTIARFFHMYLTEYVLRGFFAVFLIAMIIIFQEDLRRFFERLAIWRPRQRMDVLVDSPTEPLVTAIMRLAGKRRGALIIIKGQDHLDRHLQGGIPLNGEMSAALIESIFEVNSPGHDGALIVDKGRVTRFSCHLPLSKNSAKVARLGLRHTAALGLSELTDALCIVVSEERGTISVALEGDIKTLRNHEDIQDEIDRFYWRQAPSPKEKGRLGRLRSNPWEKGIALGLAAILWFAFGFETETIRRDITTPVAYRNLPADWIIENQDPREATLSIMGSKQAFDLFDPNTLRMIVDMSAIEEGEQVIPLTHRSVELPSNLTVVNIQPDMLTLTAHEMHARDVPLQAQTTGTLSDDLILDGIDVSPKTVKVLTARHSPDDLRLFTEPVPLDSIRTTTRFTPRVIQPPNLPFADRKPPLVTVTIRVEPKQKELEELEEETEEESLE